MGRDRSALALKRLEGNVTVTRTQRMAWYVLPAQRWSFRSTPEREGLILAAAQRYAQLAGRSLHLRVTARPYPVDRWARALDANTPYPLPGWAAHLQAEQLHVLGLTLADRQVFVGVGLHAGGSGRFAPRRVRESAESERREVDAIMAGPGFEARPVAPAELEYLLHRSVSLGAPAALTMAPEREAWDVEDMADFTDRAEWSCDRPYGRTVQIVADVNGRQYVRHIAVMTMGRMAPLEIPGGMEPWLQRSDRLPFPVEWSVRVDVLSAERVQRDMTSVMARIRSQLEHFAEHRLDPPSALARQRDRALEIEDEVSGFDPLATRTHGWVRAAVSGATEDEALSRGRQLAELYGPAITLSRGADQYRTAREFIPGEPLGSVAHKRRMPVTTLAAAVPAATAMVGDRVGIHIGQTSGASERAVMWEPWRSTEVRERSGLTIVAGGLGSGKSTLLGAVAYQSVLRGIRTVLLDPSGPLARLCAMPELADRSRAVDLMNAAPGALSPYRVVTEPLRHHYPDETEWQRARKLANAQRRTLALDVLLMLLPVALTRLPQTRMVLQQAAREVGGAPSANARQIIAVLHRNDMSQAEHARYVAGELEDIAELPQAQLIFPAAEGKVWAGDDDYLFQVLTMRGNVLPALGKAREEWSIEETMGVPLLHLASHLTSRHVYGRDMSERKLVGLDELHALSEVSSGRSLINRIARDSRKWNVRAILASQNAADITVAGIAAFLDSAFIGRTTDNEAQREALRVLGVEQGVGYEAVLGGLSPRERQSDTRTGGRDMIFSDGDDGCEKVRIHLPPRLRDVLDTTASPAVSRDLSVG